MMLDGANHIIIQYSNEKMLGAKDAILYAARRRFKTSFEADIYRQARCLVM